jgi:hypothetical protein
MRNVSLLPGDRLRSVAIHENALVPPDLNHLAFVLIATAFAAEDDNPIQKAMKFAHSAPRGQKKLNEKIVEGTASDADVGKALAMYKAMADTKPPKGDPTAFKEKTNKLVAATEKSWRRSPRRWSTTKPLSTAKHVTANTERCLLRAVRDGQVALVLALAPPDLFQARSRSQSSLTAGKECDSACLTHSSLKSDSATF